ncbi:Tat (twin-arginine translocation) pathway signal sequence [Ectothiorhodospira mobilis]|uniref:Tat (Twin-arginine translocation) pathway signal sequence n=1 Tax=Ectothiorhodospira mobilis TaxID=195064 RepID=A0A1I4SP43_ECTMO|nr:high-potential iron-sulfur protein [Ectothiorhodospira mobilis]SFM66151.1 Tat (twin-arginine translocation) pathway signal sequence [Ectothiorhodospira mobilis]
MSDHPISRRKFLKAGTCGLAAVPVAGLFWSGNAQAQERLKENDPSAQALDYVHNAADSDHADYQQGQNCLNCDLYTDPNAKDWGPCAVFPGKLVAAEGWCSAYVPRS